jgi:hypothetical protein
LARFYETLSVLHEFLGRPLASFLGKDGAGMAVDLSPNFHPAISRAL